jgi:hypothetical protein
MKRNIFKILMVAMALLILWAPLMVWGADVYNEPVRWYETKSHVVYYGICDTMGTDNSFTQWFCILGLADYPAYGWAICTNGTGTEDVNVLVEYSMSGANATALADANNSGAVDGLDALTVTYKSDTLTTYEGTASPQFKTKPIWMRLKFDGQTGNPANSDVYWWAIFRKSEDFMLSGYDDPDKTWQVPNTKDKY